MQTLGGEAIIPHSAMMFVNLSVSMVGQPNIWM